MPNDAPIVENPAVETPVVTDPAPAEPTNQLPDGIVRRFGELTAARRAAEEEVSRLRAEVEQLHAQTTQNNQNTEQPQTQDYQQLVNQMVEQGIAQRMAQQQVQQKVQSIESAGREKYGQEFDRSVQNLTMAGVGGQSFIDALTNVKGSEAVVRYLGDTANLDEALRIAQMNPVQMALTISELAPKAAKQYAKPISNAPAPMGNLDGARGSSSDGEPSASDTRAWMEWRNKNKRGR